jgi:uncharacterized protein YfaS (alpha-2-macroglobulin family)
LALEWIRQTLSGPLSLKASPARLEAPWVATTTASGNTVWQWPAELPLPTELKVTEALASSTTAVVQLESAAPAPARLGVEIGRQISRVVKSDEGYTLEPVGDDTFSTDELYLDDVTITPSRATLRYAVLEVPLPPGASVENTTWGIELPGDDGKLVGLEKAHHQATRFGYAVPVDGASETTHVRHLVRFAQKGTYVIPRARLYRMYLPSAKSFEAGDALAHLEVR